MDLDRTINSTEAKFDAHIKTNDLQLRKDIGI